MLYRFAVIQSKFLLYCFAVIQSKSQTATRKNKFQSAKIEQENFEENLNYHVPTSTKQIQPSRPKLCRVI